MAQKGLYANIHAKRERIKRGSGERMRRPGSKGAPTERDFKDAAKTVKESSGINIEPMELKYTDVNPLNPEDKQYVLELINTYPDKPWFYVVHFNRNKGSYTKMVSKGESPFVTYPEALEVFKEEQLLSSSDSVHLMFAPEKPYNEEHDNIVINQKGSWYFVDEFNELDEARKSKDITIEDIAEKHGVSIRSIEMQIEKGIKIEKEHTESEKEAKVIAMDHLVEIPDYYDRLNKMEKEAGQELQEKKKKKSKVTARDYNAKAMWGKVKAQVFKAKKGKGSFSRKGKHKGIYEALGLTLEEGTSNFNFMGKGLPLIVWMDYDSVYESLNEQAQEEVYGSLGDLVNEKTEGEIESLIEEKRDELFSNYGITLIDESELEEMQNDIDEFNDKFRDKFDSDEKEIVTIQYGYYEGAQLYANPTYLDAEQKDMIIIFFDLLKEKYYLTELSVGGTFSSGETTYSRKGKGKGAFFVDLELEKDDSKKEEPESKEDKLKEEKVPVEFIPPSDELIERFTNLLKENGYNIESVEKYGEGPHDYTQVHLQIRSKKSGFTEEQLGEEFDRITEVIDNFDPKRKNHITYSFGLTEDGFITAGLDVREEYWDSEKDIATLDIPGEPFNESKIDRETLDSFVERIKKMTGKEDIKIIEALTMLTEAKVDIDRFVAWGGQELYDKFIKLKPRLKSPENDVTYWTSTKTPRKPEELETKLGELELTKTKSQLDSEAREGAELVAENDSFLVYKIKNFEASKKYGKNSTWCIAGSKQWIRNDMQPNQYWDRYKNDGIIFYFFIRKDNTDKYAFTMYPHGSRQVYNAKNSTLGRGELSKELADAPYVPGVFTPSGYRKKKNLPHLQNARQLKYTFTSLEDYVIEGDTAIEFRRKTKGTAIVPEQIKVIDDLCFAAKPELTEIIIHKGVNYVGIYAFLGCKNLVIKCEAKSKPEDWEDEWNPDGCQVTWGFRQEGQEEEEEVEDGIEDVNVVARI